MAVVRQQAKIAGLNINKPQKDHVLSLLELLKKMEEESLGLEEANKNYIKRKGWIDRF
jgi:hypothetical protein